MLNVGWDRIYIHYLHAICLGLYEPIWSYFWCVVFFLLKVLILIKSLLKCRVIAATNLLCCRLKLSETDIDPTDFIGAFS